MAKRGPKPGQLWEHFETQPDGHTQKCTLLKEDGSECSQSFPRKLTSNAENHLRNYHLVEWEEYQDGKKKVKKIEPAPVAAPKQQQPDIRSSFQKISQSQLDQNLAKFFGGTSVSYNLVKHPFFRKLILDGYRGLSLPKSDVTIGAYVQRLKAKLCQKLITELKSAKKIFMVIDIWSKKGLAQSYLGISVIFRSPVTGKLCSAVLALRLFPHPHTAERIFEVYQKVCREFKIDPKLVCRVTTDNGANIVKCFTKSLQQIQELEETNSLLDSANASEDTTPDPAPSASTDQVLNEFGMEEEFDESEEDEPAFADCENIDDEDEGDFDKREGDCFAKFGKLKHLPCYAHCLDLVARKADLDKDFSETMDEISQFTGPVSHSGVAKEIIKKTCGRQLPSIPKTRWTYRFYYCVAVLKCISGLNAYCDHMGRDRVPRSLLAKLEIYQKVLQPFAKFSGLLGREKCPTLPGVIPSILSIEEELHSVTEKDGSDSVKSLCQLLTQSLKDRFSFVFDPDHKRYDPIYCLATMLHPEYCWVLDGSQITEGTELLKSLLVQPSGDSGERKIEAPSTSENLNQPVGFEGLQKKLMQKRKQQAASAQHSKEEYQLELDRFLQTYGGGAAAGTQLDGLEFWLSHSFDYPILSNVAQDIMCCPATSAMQERVFSLAGIACGGRRMRLTGERLEAEVMILKNSQYFDC